MWLNTKNLVCLIGPRHYVLEVRIFVLSLIVFTIWRNRLLATDLAYDRFDISFGLGLFQLLTRRIVLDAFGRHHMRIHELIWLCITS